MALEASQQIALALWIGTLVASASLAVPSILDAVSDPVEASRSALDLLARVSFLGCGAGSFLLLTTFLMHLLGLRSLRAALVQAALILIMAIAATALQVWLAPEMGKLLRATPELFQGEAGAALQRFRRLFGVYLGVLLLQALLGVVLLLSGVRRWYTYTFERPEQPDLLWP